MGKKSKSEPYNTNVTSKAYGFVQTFRSRTPISIEFFVEADKLALFSKIASHVDDPNFRGTPLSLKSGYEFAPLDGEVYDSVSCVICEDAEDLVRELVKCGLPKEVVLSGLDQCKNDDGAIYDFIDSINDGLVEMMEARVSGSNDEGWEEEETSNDDWEEETSGDGWEEECSMNNWEEDQVEDLTPAQISALLNKRFDELKEEAKSQLPKKAKKEVIEEFAFDLLKHEYPMYMEGLEYAPAS